MNHPEQIKTALGIVPSATCENCYEPHTREDLEQFDPCAVKTLLSWAVSQARIDAQEALVLMPHICPDVLWDRLSPLLDDLVCGAFNFEE